MTQPRKSKDFLALLNQGRYDEALSLMIDIKLSGEELVVLYHKARPKAKKKNRKFGIFEVESFWGSKLPFYHLDHILSSSLRVPFWSGFFSNDRFCNIELAEYLWLLGKADFIRHFKLSAFDSRANFINALASFSSRDQAAAEFHSEIEWARKELHSLKEEEKTDTQEILEHSLKDVLVGYSLFHYALKQDEQVAGNKEWQTSVEIALIEDLDRVLKAFVQSKKTLNIPIYENQTLQQEFELNRVPHKWLEPNKKRREPQNKYVQIDRLISRAIKRKIRTSEIEIYRSGYSDIRNLNSQPYFVRNHSFKRFQLNDRKGLLEELYINPFLDNVRAQNKNSIESSLSTFEFYGFPDRLDFPCGKVSLRDLLRLLKDFSVFKGPPERQFFSEIGTQKLNYGFTFNKPPEAFAKLFGSNESISLFIQTDLIEKLTTYYGWDKNACEHLLSLLTLDLSQPLPRKWIWRPLIKVGDKIILLGSFMKDRRWENLLINRLKDERNVLDITIQLSSGFENSIKNAFDEQGFTTLGSHRFKNSNGETGEIDVLAFKDNHLYVIEAKQGIRSNDFTHAAEIEVLKVDGQAAEQLAKIQRYIRNEWNRFTKEWPVLDGFELNSIEITSLIVTDGFEADRTELSLGIRKLSFLELKVILTNTKEKLFENYLKIVEARSGLNPSFKTRELSKKFKWDLWDGQKRVSGKTLIDRIDDNSVWTEFENLWHN